MKKLFLLSSFLMSVMLIYSCASSYKSIHPERISYVKDSPISGELTTEYQFKVLTESNNRKYYKKENKSRIQLVAVKITNNSDQDIRYNKDFQLYSADNILPLLPLETVHNSLKQQAPLYLLYLAATPAKLYTNTTTVSGQTYFTENSETFPIGFIIGPGLALYNVVKASSANTQFKKELMNHNLEGKIIRKGESFYALIGISNTSFRPISARFTNNTTATNRKLR